MKNRNIVISVLCAVLAVVLLAMIIVLCTYQEPEQTVVRGEYVAPTFDENAVSGTPEVPDELGYFAPYKEGMAYRVAACGSPTATDTTLTVYFTNTEGNEKYLKLRVLDEDGRTLGETGLLRPGEYVETVALSESVSPGTALKYKVLGYEPDDLSSAGSILLNVTVGGTVPSSGAYWLWIVSGIAVVAVIVIIICKKSKKHA